MSSMAALTTLASVAAKALPSSRFENSDRVLAWDVTIASISPSKTRA